MELKPWQIPRSDKRDRCGECFAVFKKGQIKRRYKGSLLRFPNKCFKCLAGLT